MSNLIPHPTAESLASDIPVTPDPDEPNGPQWTQAKMAAFLRHLSAAHCVAEAARSVEMSRQSAYKLRARLKGEPFDLAWRCATRRQFDALAQVALERAINGVEVPHLHKGEVVHTSRRYDERLTVALLNMRHRIEGAIGWRKEELEFIHPDDLDELVGRVERGGEYWELPDPELEDSGADEVDDSDWGGFR